MIKKFIFFTFTLLSVVYFASCTREVKSFEFTSIHMGTRFQIILYSADETTARNAAQAAFDRVEELIFAGVLQPSSHAMNFLCTGVTPGFHSVKIQFKSNDGVSTVTLYGRTVAVHYFK
jgi:hypothetical protein